MLTNKKILFQSMLLLSASVLTACGGGSTGDSPEVTGIIFSSNNTQVPVNNSTKLEITAELSDGTTEVITTDISWESDNVELVSISEDGVITTSGVGSVTITATYNGISQTKTIEVTSDNISPIINSNALVSATEGVSYSYDVDATDINDDELNYELSTSPEGMTINSDTGLITWTPTAGQVGNNDVSIIVSDNGTPSLEDEQTFVLDVAEKNSMPAFTSTAILSAVDGVGYSYKVTADDVNSNNLSFSLDSAPVGMTIDSDGNIVWVPTSDQIGTHIVRIAVTDDAVDSLTTYQQFILTVESANVAPVFNSTAGKVAKEESAYNYAVSVNDANNVTFELTTKPAGMSINPRTGEISWTPTNNQNGLHDVVILATDDGKPSMSATQTFQIAVDESNVAPVFSSRAIKAAKEESAYNYAVSVNDANNVTFELTTKPAGMSVDPQTGVVSWMPSNNQNGSHDVVILATDDGVPSMSATQAFQIAVAESNVAPVFSSEAVKVAKEESAYNYAVSVNDANNVTFELTTKPEGMSVDPQTGVISWMPSNNQNGSHDVVILATDDGVPSMSATQAFQIAVAESNVAPVITSTAGSVAEADVEYSYQLEFTDENIDDQMSFELVGEPEGMSVSSSGLITWTPTPDQLGAINNVSVIVSDNGVPVMTAVEDFAVGVADVSAPTMPANLTIYAGKSNQINLNWESSTDVGGGMVAGYALYRNGALIKGDISADKLRYFDKSNLSTGVEYTYELKAYDNALNESVDIDGNTILVPNYSLAATATLTILDLPYFEDFSNGAPHWVPFDDFTEIQVDDGGEIKTVKVKTEPSLWIEDTKRGQYTQDKERGIVRGRNSKNAALNESYHLGTYSYLHGAGWMKDFQVSAKLYPTIENPNTNGKETTDDGHDVGLMFRYINNDNYYRVSFNREYGYTRLERKLNGEFTTLAVDAQGYILEGEMIYVKVIVVGDLIQVYVDNNGNYEGDPADKINIIDPEPRFAVKDGMLTRGTVALYTQDRAIFKDVSIDEYDLVPSVVINRPIAHSSQTGADIAVSAVALNGDIVDFAMDGGACAVANETSPGYFESTCFAATKGDHTITASLKTAGNEVAVDTNVKVGALGDVRIVIGDSLSNGVKDTYTLDNHSVDGKVIGEQGYAAVLQDLLNAPADSAPQMVYNEAVPGDTSDDLANKRIDSIIQRHPEANIAQILIGTNDSTMGVSVVGVQNNIQKLVDTLTANNITPVIAQLPPNFTDIYNPLDSAENAIVESYNAMLRNEFNASGPDLYSYFVGAGQNRVSMFEDALHFNGLGYHIVGHLWHHYLTGGTSLPARADLPLVLEDLCMVNSESTCQLDYKQDYMQVGNALYIDTPAYQTAVSKDAVLPAILDGGIWIKPSIAERRNDRDVFLSFNVDRDVDVYVAFESSSILPNWLSDGSWVDTGEVVTTTNSDHSTMTIYKKSFTAGTVELGGNRAGGGNSSATYLTIVKEATI